MSNNNIEETIYCEQSLLNCIAHGHSIIAELTNLSRHIPDIFISSGTQIKKKYEKVVFNFEYFRDQPHYEKIIHDNKILTDSDKEIHIKYNKYITRFYLVLFATYKYIECFNKICKRLESDEYQNESYDTLIGSKEGKHFLCEALFLSAFIMLYIDIQFSGDVRESLLVSYHRRCYSDVDSDQTKDLVFQFFRSSRVKFNNEGNFITRPEKYPESYLERACVSNKCVNMVLEILRTDDLYSQTTFFPLPEHRPTALRFQAALIFIILFLTPENLNKNESFMTNVVDRYFNNSWIITVYLGVPFNLFQWWSPYSNAISVLTKSFLADNIKQLADKHLSCVNSIFVDNYILKLNKYASVKHLLTNNKKLIDFIRNFNISLTWILVHALDNDSSKISLALKDALIKNPNFNMETIFKALLVVSKLEKNCRDNISALFLCRDEEFEKQKAFACEQISMLVHIFEGDSAFKIERNDKLSLWFSDKKKIVESMSLDNPRNSLTTFNNLIDTFTKLKEYQEIYSKNFISQIIDSICTFFFGLNDILRFNEKILIELQVVTDFTCGWLIFKKIIPIIQRKIVATPDILVDIRYLLLKLSSAIETPLIRLSQSESADFELVSDFYSTILLKYCEEIFQSIPQEINKIMNELSKIYENQQEISSYRVSLDQVKRTIFFDNRFKIQDYIHRIAVYCSGVQKMKTTLVGIVNFDPQLLVEEAIKKHLIDGISSLMQDKLQLKCKSTEKPQVFINTLSTISCTINAICSTLICLQDYLKINVPNMWNDIQHQICQYFSNQQILVITKSNHIESASFMSHLFGGLLEETSQNIFGLILSEILTITSPSTTIYSPYNFIWRSSNSYNDIINGRMITYLIESSLGIHGLITLKYLLSLHIDVELSKLYKLVITAMKNNEMKNSFYNCFNLKVNVFDVLKARDKNIQAFMNAFAFSLANIGQLEILVRLCDLRLCTRENFNSYPTMKAFQLISMQLNRNFEDTCKIMNEDDLKMWNVMNAYINKKLQVYGISESQKHPTDFSRDMIPTLFVFIHYSLGKYEYNQTKNIFTFGTNSVDFYSTFTGLSILLQSYEYCYSEKLVSVIVQHFFQQHTKIASQIKSKGFILKEIILCMTQLDARFNQLIRELTFITELYD